MAANHVSIVDSWPVWQPTCTIYDKYTWNIVADKPSEMTAPSHFSTLSEAIEQSGFALRGGFHAAAGDGVPSGAVSVLLIGNIGSAGFEQFRRSAEWRTGADPLDRYTERIIGDLAQMFAADAVFPWQGPPWWPFQRWAQRAEAVSVSPLRILIHPRHGLWHAYRAALFFERALPGLPAEQRGCPGGKDSFPAETTSPCTDCYTKPCLTACPVDAFREGEFDDDRCARHLDTPAGHVCMTNGCAARNACPQGAQARYVREHQQFHMRAFLAGREN